MGMKVHLMIKPDSDSFILLISLLAVALIIGFALGKIPENSPSCLKAISDSKITAQREMVIQNNSYTIFVHNATICTPYGACSEMGNETEILTLGVQRANGTIG
jgi:hypothetical protein